MLLSLFPLSLLAAVANALVNVSIDDTDPSILYKGTWDPSSIHKSSLDYGSTHTYSSDASASATLTFTGVAIYYLAPLWPYPVSTQLRLDGGAPVIVNLTDPIASTTSEGGSESAQSSVAWYASGLSNTTHTLVLSMAPTGDAIVADGFIFTVNNGSSPSSSSISSSSPWGTAAASLASQSTIPFSPKKQTNALSIGLAIGLGLLALLAACVVFYFLFYRRRSKNNHHVLFDSWGGHLDSNDDEDTKAAITPFLAGVSGPTRQAYTHSATASASSSDTHPLLVTPFVGSTLYQDEPSSRTSAISASGKSAARSSAASDLTSAATGSSRGAANPNASAVRVDKSRPSRPEVLPAPPAYSE
ncbi:hypothetical protein C8F01DRAFT_1164551 [Mycena amicta]|nr:hypothetical protein C8F01DRAFT_1164551 [Mycena amicta]